MINLEHLSVAQNERDYICVRWVLGLFYFYLAGFLDKGISYSEVLGLGSLIGPKQSEVLDLKYVRLSV